MKTIFQKLQKIPLNPKVYRELPENPGIYIYSRKGVPIYVGKAINLRKRVASYFRLNLESKTERMIKDAEYISFIKVGNELEALLLEAKLIKLFMPKYNIIAKDDKHPLYIQITKSEFPTIQTVRKNDLDKVPSLVTYGPFPSSGNVKSVLKMIRKIFPYSDHKVGKKACLYSQIGLCDPCPSEITNNQDLTTKLIQIKKYKANIRHIKAILDGKIEKVKTDLEKEMRSLSDVEKYEEARIIRNKIQRLEYITSPNLQAEEYLVNPNLNEDMRDKEMVELGKILTSFKFNIKKPVRIECYDIAHLQGANATASMVTFVNGEPAKEFYRHFRIRQKKGNDDYASMREVINRRKKHFDDWGRPELIIVDGGKGQMSIFHNELKSENIAVIGLAKRLETLVVPTEYLGANAIREYRLPRGNALNLVQRLRNEAHRFARVYHHKLFSRSLIERKS